MTLPIYQIDAFAEEIFRGNPAAVVPLDEWLSDEILQKIALENNLSETAYIVKTENGFHIRWFTPTVEVDLCGHATLATAYYLFYEADFQGDKIVFASKSGELTVTRSEDWLTLNFPAQEVVETFASEELISAVGKTPTKALRAKDDWMLVYETEEEIAEIRPNFSELATVKARGVIVTARSQRSEIDFVSRFFAPASGVNEDPVTGSAHTKLFPYWGKELEKTKLNALQLSAREGFLIGEIAGERVLISGKARLYLRGNIIIS